MKTFYFDKLNIGGSLTALLHAYKTGTPIIIDKPHLPFELEFCPDEWDLSFVGFSQDIPVSKLHLWERLSFLLSMAGLVIFPNNIQDARHSKNTVTIITTGNQRINVVYKEAFLFDKDREDYYYVHDWFYIKSGGNHGLNLITDDSDFCSKIIFYPSMRSSVRKDVKDLCVISKIPATQIDSIEHSPIYVRLKSLRMMKNAGIVGKINGYNKHGQTKHLSVKIEHAFRERTEVFQNAITIPDLLRRKLNKKSDLWNLTQKFIRQKTHSTLRALSQ